VTARSGGPNPTHNSKPANEVTTCILPPATRPETDQPDRKRTAGTCEVYREAILLELSRGRKASGRNMADLHGFAGGYLRIPVMWAADSARCGPESERSDAGWFLP